MDYFEDIKKRVADLEIGMVIVNAGAMHTGRFEKQTGLGLQQMLDANVYHFAAMLKKFIPVLISNDMKQCGIIITASLATLTPLANNAAYHASKVFESHMGEAIQFELIEDIKTKIHMHIACPSFVRTELLGDAKVPSAFTETSTAVVKSIIECFELGDLSTFGTFLHEVQSYSTRLHYSFS